MQEVNSKKLATRTKNDLMKYLKRVLNYCTKCYDFNFTFINTKIKCRKSVKINVGFPTFLISVTITIEVIVNMNMENENKLRNMLKEMIRLNIKPNFAALGREYGCDYRTAKIKYYEEQNKEKGIEIVKKSRKYIIGDYKELIINKLETIPGITAYSIYYFLKVEKGYNGSYETIKNFVRSNKDKRKQPASIRVEPIIGKSAQVDWKEDFKLTNKDGDDNVNILW